MVRPDPGQPQDPGEVVDEDSHLLLVIARLLLGEEVLQRPLVTRPQVQVADEAVGRRLGRLLRLLLPDLLYRLELAVEDLLLTSLDLLPVRLIDIFEQAGLRSCTVSAWLLALRESLDDSGWG